jgi:hypothetical protein
LHKLTTSLEKLPFVRISVVSGVFGAIALYLLVNFIIIMLGAMSGQNLMRYVWPAEVFLFASFLAILGWSTEKWGLMIPSGIVFGNALILAYCALTGRWGDWAFLWVTELLFIWLSIFLPVQISRIQNAGPIWARIFGPAMTGLCLLCVSVNVFLAFMVASINQFIS